MKNVNTEQNQYIIDKLNLIAQALGKAICQSEAYENYLNAREQFRTDESAKEAARQYNAVLNDYQMRARFGGVTPDDDVKIEEARKIARQNVVLDNYYLSQEKLIAFYQELNDYISDKLKFDFASLAKPSGGCCG